VSTAVSAFIADRGRVSAVIADDEPLLCAQLRTRLSRLWPELSVVHEMGDGRDVDGVIARHAPRLFFLDIHMPGVNGLDAARAIGDRAHVVFVTAFDEYAVQAFERGAIDYVLKPFDEERLAVTVGRLKERLGARPPALEELVESLAGRLAPREPSHLRWIKASVGPNVRLIPVEEVIFFQSDEKYTRVVAADGEALIRKPIRELLAELDPAKFWQVHRATIVNVDHIASVRRGLKDQAEIQLRGCAETLIVSRAFTHLFKQM
jgi:DNA-binding LytR/AlgR family response regulator